MPPSMSELATPPRKRLAVVSAGLGTPSSTRLLADRLANDTAAHLAAADAKTEVTTIELRDYAVDITRNLLQGFASPDLDAMIDKLAAADGAILVTPIFSASYSGLFKSFIDILDPDALTGLPVLIGATGGTERHSLALEFALRPLFAYLRAVVVPTGVFAATSDWGGTDSKGTGGLVERIDRGAGQLATLIRTTDRVTVDRPSAMTFRVASGSRAR